MTIKSAMIFAAGFGTRMGALTRETPKPMLPLRGRPMIDHCIDLLRDAGIETIVANTHYRPVALEAHLRAQDVTALREEVILETGGGLKAARDALGSDLVITMNPDALWHGNNPVKALLAGWREEMTGLLMLTETEGEASDFSLEHGEMRRNGRFRYTGLQALRLDRLCEIESKIFSLNVFWDLLMSCGPLNGMVYQGGWTDIGTEAALVAANGGPR